MENKEMIKHTIKIDQFCQLTLLIPKELDVLEFKSLMTKANKLFNLSGGNLLLSATRKFSAKPGQSIFSPEEDEYIIKNYQPGIRGLISKLAKELNKTPTQVASHVRYMMKKGRIGGKENGSHSF